MSHTFFAECSFKNTIFDNTKFIQTEFFHTSLKDIDFSTSTLEGICISDDANELKGAVVILYQAADLAKLLGLVIKDT